MSKQSKNIENLRDDLLSDFEALKDGSMSIPLGKARTAAARTAVSSAKVEMDYNKQIGQADKRIKFLEVS
jgi:hypothetical protein